MTDAITISRYEGGQIQKISAAAGWHEVARSRSGMQLLLHPSHPALVALLVRE
jgi:hypothetical protein